MHLYELFQSKDDIRTYIDINKIQNHNLFIYFMSLHCTDGCFKVTVMTGSG